MSGTILSPLSTSPTPNLHDLPGGGLMAEFLRKYPWARTPLGPIEDWPQSLKTAVSLCLSSRFPLIIFWGRDLIQIYNDAFLNIAGNKHPAAFGQKAQECWPEMWSTISPLYEHVFATGTATWAEHIHLPVRRHGYLEESFYTMSYTPVFLEDGAVGGIFNVILETTLEVVAERRTRVLRDLAARTSEAKTVMESCTRSTEVLSRSSDIPFSMIYLLEPTGAALRLMAAAGMSQIAAMPSNLLVHSKKPWPIQTALEHRKVEVVSNVIERFGHIPGGPWGKSVEQAVILPLVRSSQANPYGLLIAGITPQRALDRDFLTFLRLVSGQVATAINNTRAYEEECKRAEVLAELDRAKTLFFSNVSHEFRTPLTLMLEPLQDVLEEARDRLLPADRERLTIAHRNGQRLLKLVNTLLDFSRIEAGRVQAVYEPVDLAQLTAELASVFESACTKAGLRLFVDCPALPDPVYLDRDMWEKIVLNLLSNAYKYTLQGEIRVSVRSTRNHAVLTVSDTGIGIPEYELPQLFNRFYRVEGARGRTQEGTGIGLALVQELIKLHGGTIEVKSAIDQGSTFTVRIPIGKAHLPPERILATRQQSLTAIGPEAFVNEALRWQHPGSEPDIEPKAEPQNAELSRSERNGLTQQRVTILLADDNADMRDYVRRLLSERYNVVAVHDGQEALAQAAKLKPALVLTDVMMPNLDGFGLLRALRASPDTKAIPVIMLSARAGEEARVEGLSAGADDYLVKPFSARELLARVQATITTTEIRREAEQRVTNILDSITDGFVGFDSEWRYTYVNREAEKQLGRSRHELLGKLLWEAFPDIVGSAIENILRRCARKRTAYTFEEQSAGRWYNNRVYPTPDGGIAIFFHETTEQRRVEQTLATSELRFRLALRSNAITVYEQDENLRYTWLYPEIAEAIGHTDDELALEQDGVNLTRIKRQVLTTGQPTRQEVFLRRPGQAQYFDLVVEPRRNPMGKVIGVCGVALDITQRKQAEQSLQEADRRKDDFIAMLAHELRNPLGPIRTGVHILRQIAPADDRIEKIRATIERQATHMSRIVDDLLDVSRITRGKILLKKEPIELGMLVHEACADYQQDAQQGGITLDIRNIDPRLYVYGDRTRLSQCVGNLLHNAIKFSPPGSHITIDCVQAEDNARVTISDSGVGIAPDILDMLFQPFVQDRQTLDRSRGGLGLGLAMVKGLVQLHDGKVEVASEGRDKGARFTILLPLIKCTAQKRSTNGSMGLAQRRVLIIEDNEDSTETLRMMLELEHHIVQTAASGEAAMKLTEVFIPDIILCDIGLPVMDGYAVCRELRKRAELQSVKIIAITGYGQDEDVRRAAAAGFDLHLTKPVAPEKLIEAIRHVSLPAQPANSDAGSDTWGK